MSAPVYDDNPKDPLLRASDFARRKKVSRQAVSKMMLRHGVRLDKSRRAPLSVWLAADAEGQANNKDPMLRASDFARRKKVSRQAVSKMMLRHGVKLSKYRRAPLSAWLAADAKGKAMDKQHRQRTRENPAGSEGK